MAQALQRVDSPAQYGVLLEPEVAAVVQARLAAAPAHWIGGTRAVSEPGNTLPVEDPGLAQEVTRIARGREGDVADAVVSAQRAFEQWRSFRAIKRAEILDKASSLIRANVKVLGALESIDTG